MLLLCGSCASYESHLFDMGHPWHAVPAAGTVFAGFVPFAPGMLVEGLIRGRAPSICEPGVFGAVGGAVGYGLAYVVGGAFYVAGLPLELVVPLEEEARGRSPSAAPPQPNGKSATEARSHGGTELSHLAARTPCGRSSVSSAPPW